MIRLPPRYTLTDTLLPCMTHFRTAVKGQHEEGAENLEQDIYGERRGPFHRRVFSLRISTFSTSTFGFLPVQSVATRRTPRRIASRSASRLRSRAGPVAARSAAAFNSLRNVSRSSSTGTPR